MGGTAALGSLQRWAPRSSARCFAYMSHPLRTENIVGTHYKSSAFLSFLYSLDFPFHYNCHISSKIQWLLHSSFPFDLFLLLKVLFDVPEHPMLHPLSMALDCSLEQRVSQSSATAWRCPSHPQVFTRSLWIMPLKCSKELIRRLNRNLFRHLAK